MIWQKLWTKNGMRASMSAKNKDDKNRWRNKNVGFRCSPEEGIEIDKRWKMCGFTSVFNRKGKSDDAYQY